MPGWDERRRRWGITVGGSGGLCRGGGGDFFERWHNLLEFLNNKEKRMGKRAYPQQQNNKIKQD